MNSGNTKEIGQMNAETKEKLQNAILADLIKEGGTESVSNLFYNLKTFGGWRGLGCLADFETLCSKLGFTVRKGVNSRNQRRTEVTL
jgi:hypothetical protein